MIAEHDVQPPPGRGGFGLQAHDEVEHTARIGTAVEQIAEAHDMCRTGGPAEVLADHTRSLEQLDERPVRAVHVAEHDDTRHISPWTLFRVLPERGRYRQRQGQRHHDGRHDPRLGP